MNNDYNISIVLNLLIDVIEKQIRVEINKNSVIYKNKLITLFEESK